MLVLFALAVAAGTDRGLFRYLLLAIRAKQYKNRRFDESTRRAVAGIRAAR